MSEASFGSVDRAMRTLGLSGVRRDKGIRTTIPAKDGIRAGDLLDRNFTAAAPNLVWFTDFTYVRTWAGFTDVAFIVDVYAQWIVAWHAAPIKHTDLVMIPLRMALWQRDREGHPTAAGELIHHSDAGSQGEINRSSPHPDHGGVHGTTRRIDDDGDGCPAMRSPGRPPIRRDVERAFWIKIAGGGRVRASPPRCPQPRAAPRMGTAENLWPFTLRAPRRGGFLDRSEMGEECRCQGPGSIHGAVPPTRTGRKSHGR